MTRIQHYKKNIVMLLLISCVTIYAEIAYKHRTHHTTHNIQQSTIEFIAPNNAEQQLISNALEKAIFYSHEVGAWLEDLFDVHNNITYTEHVKHLKRILIGIQQDFVIPLKPQEHSHPTIQKTYHVALLLLQKIENTYAVLKSYRGTHAYFRLALALNKALDSSQAKSEFDTTLQKLHSDLQKSNAMLDQKLTEFEKSIALSGERINSKGWRALVNGLWHRLNCK